MQDQPVKPPAPPVPPPHSPISSLKPVDSPDSQEKKPKKFIFIILIILAIALGATGGVFGYQYVQKQKLFQTQPSPTPIVQQPSPSPDPTASWETYTNEVFSVKAPKEFVKNEKGSQENNLYLEYNNISIEFYFPKVPAGFIECSSNEDSINQSLISYKGAINAGSGGKYNILDTSISNNSIKGIEYFDTNTPLKAIYDYPLCFQSKRYQIKFTISGNIEQARQVLPQINQILSTFKFIDEIDETAGWETYTNTTYSFSFKYPSDWKNITTEKEVEEGNRTVTIETKNKELINGTVFDSPADSQNDRHFDLKNGKSILFGYAECSGPGCAPGKKDIKIFNQILSTFEFLD